MFIKIWIYTNASHVRVTRSIRHKLAYPYYEASLKYKSRAFSSLLAKSSPRALGSETTVSRVRLTRENEWLGYCIYRSQVACCSSFVAFCSTWRAERNRWLSVFKVRQRTRTSGKKKSKEKGGSSEETDEQSRRTRRVGLVERGVAENEGIMEKRRLSSTRSLLDVVNGERRATDSRWPIKSPTGLDLSTNEQQLLTFKVDERSGEAWRDASFSLKSGLHGEACSILIAPLPFIRFRRADQFVVSSDKRREQFPGFDVCHDVRDNYWDIVGL